MKMFKFLSIAVSVAVAQQYNGPIDPVDPVDPVDPGIPGGVSCWHCDAANMTHCMEIGMQKNCPENAQSCMVEARKRGGQLESVSPTNVYMSQLICYDSSYAKPPVISIILSFRSVWDAKVQ